MAFSLSRYQFQTESILDGLPAHEHDQFMEKMMVMELSAGDMMFRQGSYSRGIYILKKGKVKIFQLDKKGNEQIVYIYRRGDIMGYRALLCNETHPVSSIALEDCVIWFVPRKNFLTILNQSAVLPKKLLVNLSHEFGVWINTMTILAQQPVKERIAFVLLLLNDIYRRSGGGGDLHPVINLSREDFARYARTTIETVARTLTIFRDEGILETRGRRITIHQPSKLEKIADFH